MNTQELRNWIRSHGGEITYDETTNGVREIEVKWENKGQVPFDEARPEWIVYEDWDEGNPETSQFEMNEDEWHDLDDLFGVRA